MSAFGLRAGLTLKIDNIFWKSIGRHRFIRGDLSYFPMRGWGREGAPKPDVPCREIVQVPRPAKEETPGDYDARNSGSGLKRRRREGQRLFLLPFFFKILLALCALPTKTTGILLNVECWYQIKWATLFTYWLVLVLLFAPADFLSFFFFYSIVTCQSCLDFHMYLPWTFFYFAALNILTGKLDGWPLVRIT